MNQRYILTGVMLAAALVASVLWIKSTSSTAVSPDSAAHARSKGNPHAEVQIIEYSDFQCPACRLALPVLDEIMTRFGDRVFFSFRHYPLSVHSFSLVVHQAAECAARQGQFWPYHDRLYQNQKEWAGMKDPVPQLLEYASETGMNLDLMGECLSDSTVTAQILEEAGEGKKLSVRMTPTFFVGDKRFVGAVELREQGIAFIEQQLSSDAA